jgi:hypothetical protein
MRVRNRNRARRVFLRPLSIGLIASVALLMLISGGVSKSDQKINGYSETVPMPLEVIQAMENSSLNFNDPEPADAPMLGSEAAPPVIDEAVWENGELIALPKDPDKRRVARDQARARAAAKGGGAPDVTYYPSSAGGKTSPIVPTSQVLSNETPPGAYRATPAQMEMMNLRLPDDFELPDEVLCEITEATGQLDSEAEGRMEGALALALIQSFGGIDQTTLTPPD